MSRRKGRVIDRFLAILLSVMLVVSMLPTATLPVMAATEDHQDSFTVSVTDGSDPLKGVVVSLSAKGEEWSLDLSENTGEDGVAVFETSAIEEALSYAGIEQGTIKYTVTKAGYDDVIGEIEITASNLVLHKDVIMTVSQAEPEEHTLSVRVSNGDAVVKLNSVEQNSVTVEANTEVDVEITPAEGSYIKKITVGEEEKIVTKGEAYTDTITVVDKNIEIVLEVVKEYTVSLKDTPEGGTVTFDGNEVSSVTVDENTSVSLEVSASTGYQISSVSIDGQLQTITDKTNFSLPIYATRNIEVIVAFVKVYTIEVIHNQNGTVVTDPTTTGGHVTVEEGETIKITADPDDNYRVSEVVIDGVVDSDVTGENYSDIDVYTKELPAGDYSIVITFAPNRYKVTKSEPENGNIELSTGLVDYNGACVVTVTPDEGYSVSSVQVNGDDIENFEVVEEAKDGVITFTINNITKAKEVSATFVQTAANSKNIKELFNSTDAISFEGMTFYYAKDATIIFATDTINIADIRIYDEENKLIADADSNPQTFTINETVTISKIQLRYKADGELTEMWHDVEAVSAQAVLKFIIDKTPSTITLIPSASDAFCSPNNNEDEQYSLYNKESDVVVDVEVKDGEPSSGIKSIDYWITNNGVKTEGGNLFTTDEASQEELADGWNGTISVNKEENNSCNVVVYVKVIDNAGNEITEPIKLAIDKESPSISVIFDNGNDNNGNGCFDAPRTATVVITERKHHFDEEAATAGIVISALGKDNETPVANAYTISGWTSIENTENPDLSTHTATITFSGDANYEWSISYTDLAGNENTDPTTSVENGTSVAAFKFTVDTTKPTGTVKVNEYIWDKILDTLTFGLYDKTKADISATATDNLSLSVKMEYYKTDGSEAMTKEQLDSVTFEPYEDFCIETDEQFVVYLKLTDDAGNYNYISSDGYVVDTQKSTITLTQSEEDGLYNANSDVKVDVNVVDGEPYSGIKSIEYWVENNGVKTQSSTLYSYEYTREEGDENERNTNGGKLTITDWDSEKQTNTTPVTIEGQHPTQAELTSSWNGTIVVDKEANNSCDVDVYVKVVDNAGNETTESINLDIDATPPSISVTFDNGNDNNGNGWFDAPRVATVVITERKHHFDETAATEGIVISAINKEGKTVENAYTIADWEPVENTENTYKATITFAKDANYEWSINYTDKAGNKNTEPTTSVINGTSVAPFKFTIDTTEPTGTVTVNENTWDKLLNVLTFGLYSNTKVNITATATDNLSQVVKMEYYKTSNPIAMTRTELDNVTFEPYQDFSIETDEQFVIYLKLTDDAGNYTYISSDGYIVDKSASTITLTPSAANGFYNADANKNGQYGLYNKDSDVVVDIKVEDAEPYSGIKSIEYWVENNNVETQRATLYSYIYTREKGDENGRNTNGGTLTITDWDSTAQKNTVPVTIEGKHPTQAELTKSWNGKIVVDKTLNNSCNVVVYVKTIDNAGNENVKSVNLDIDTASPSIFVTFDNGNDHNGNTYFDAQRKATVVITERVHHFDASAATKGIVIKAVDAEGKAVENAYTISNWTTVENTENPDASTHTATITFAKDANYTWSITYTDLAGNANTAVTTSVINGTSVAAFDFTVDTTVPTGTVKAVSSEGRETEWDALKKSLTFGFWSKDKITVSGTFDDLTSGSVYSIEYYKVKSTSATDGTTALTAEQLDEIKWNALEAKAQKNEKGTYYSYDGIAVSKDEQFVVYVKLTDLAGNYTYLSTNGLIVDHTAPLEETIAPEVTVKPEQPINGIYNGDVKVDIKVAEPLVGGTYAGLNNITYKVFNMGEETQSGELFAFNIKNPKQSELVQTWTGSITVDSELNNSNDVKIVIYAKDNSLNTSEGDVTIKVDTTAPVIDISYDNNAADSGKYFKENRTASIVVTERNFNAEDVKVTITNTDGVVPAIGEWKKVEGTGNEDDTKWTTNIVYSADGDYTFDIAYTDLAGNKCTDVSYGDSVAATEFTLDKTIPVISVNYDNNTAMNANFFKAARTATITITEHNFDVNRVVFAQSAALDGTTPDVSWSNNGDVHTATVVYSKDGNYTFDVTMTDMAGNENDEASYGNSVAGKDFVVDQNIDKPVISGVENGKAYTGDVIPTISFNDVNYASYEVTLERTRMRDKNVDVTDEFITGVNEDAQGGSGTYDTFEKIVENDGIYTLRVKMLDKAGNEEVEEVTFTVNRFGSVYVYSDYLVSLIKDGGQYIKIIDGNTEAITNDLVITEYNADRLLEGSLKILVTRDGQALDVDFDMNPVDMNTEVAIGESGWYEYEYIIKASNFAEDGVYKISLSSAYETADAEANESTSVPENSLDENGNQIIDTMNFTVDTTAPEIRNIVNLDNTNGIADEDKISDEGLKVSYTIVDVGGLKTVDIMLNGKVHETITEFGDSAFNYNGSFYIPEDTKTQTVQIVVTDMAGNVTDTSSDDFDTKGVYVFNNQVLVSRDAWVRFVNNPILLWGSIGGTTVVLGGIGSVITARRKRKVK